MGVCTFRGDNTPPGIVPVYWDVTRRPKNSEKETAMAITHVDEANVGRDGRPVATSVGAKPHAALEADRGLVGAGQA